MFSQWIRLLEFIPKEKRFVALEKHGHHRFLASGNSRTPQTFFSPQIFKAWSIPGRKTHFYHHPLQSFQVRPIASNKPRDSKCQRFNEESKIHHLCRPRKFYLLSPPGEDVHSLWRHLPQNKIQLPDITCTSKLCCKEWLPIGSYW